MRSKRPFYTIYLLLLVLIFSSCQQYDNEFKPSATGRIDEIILVSQDKYWNGDVGQAVKAVLRQDYPMLPQPEPYFDVNYIPYSVLNNLFQKASTIVFVVPLDEPGELRDFVESYRSRVSETNNLEGKNHFVIKDLWAQPQQVIFVYGNTRAELISYLEGDTKKLLRAVQRMENKKALKNILAAGANLDFVADLKKNVGVSLDIPRTFRAVIMEEDVAWFRQDIEGAIENIMFQSLPISSAGALNGNLPIYLRDAMGKMVSTENEGAHMVTDTIVGVQQKRIKIDGMEAIETRGLWKMKGDFMGGPFINYCIKDAANDRYVMMDMFVYAPQFKKRRYIRRMEAFLPTAKMSR